MLKIKTSTAPPLKFLFAHPAHFIACGCGSGLSPFAPGTAGTLFAWLTFPLFSLLPNAMTVYVLLGILFVLGVAACQVTGRNLGVVDHGSIVWDEIVPFWTVLVFVPAGLSLTALGWQLLAFLLFRFFDIIKPFLELLEKADKPLGSNGADRTSSRTGLPLTAAGAPA